MDSLSFYWKASVIIYTSILVEILGSIYTTLDKFESEGEKSNYFLFHLFLISCASLQSDFFGVRQEAV